ncbi:MAG TPA: hypothetical protein ENI60_02995 [Candidatus Fraserbacteria bacterium]|nr:hypothetical protein [Candidatus Fraserbacteria bacterium]
MAFYLRLRRRRSGAHRGVPADSYRSRLSKLALLLTLVAGVAWAVSSGQSQPATSPEMHKAQASSVQTGSALLRPRAKRRSLSDRRGIYLTAGTAADAQRISALIIQLRRADLNTVVIDMKTMSGQLVYPSQVPLAQAIGARGARVLTLPIKALLARLHRAGLYVIARQVVFYDPLLARRLQSPEAPWVSPLDRRVVSYNLAIARELAQAGFDELQFDYLRFPDGDRLGGDYRARYQAILHFLQLARQQLAGRVYLSVDVFGRTLWAWNTKQIDPIGQDLQEMSRYVDVFSPMIYPSHYEEARFRDHPGQTIRESLESGLARGLKLRPYLQAFDMRLPQGMTLVNYIRAQVRAARALGFNSYLFWNPSSDYRALWQALERK